MTLVEFIASSISAQLDHVAIQGRVLAPRWENDHYVASYQVPDGLLVEISYHLHSGVLYQVRAYPLPSYGLM